MNFHIITLFPESFSSYLNESILKRAQKEKKIKFSFYNPRDFAKPTKSQKKNEKPYLRVDDKPYGGGAGMVLQAEPILKAFSKVEKKIRTSPPTPLLKTGVLLASFIKKRKTWRKWGKWFGIPPLYKTESFRI